MLFLYSAPCGLNVVSQICNTYATAVLLSLSFSTASDPEYQARREEELK